MKPLLIALISTTALCIAKPAQASHRHHHPFHRHHHHQEASTSRSFRHHARRHGVRYAHHGSGSVTGRPSAWCGWQMRQWMHVADAAYNLARNWAHYGHGTTPHQGAIVVWPHHVGRIVGPCQGNSCVVESGNDGHAVRTRRRSIAGAIAFRE
jgi:hypothetical protein